MMLSATQLFLNEQYQTLLVSGDVISQLNLHILIRERERRHTYRTFRPKLDPFQYHVDCVLKVFQYPSHQFGISYNSNMSSSFSSVSHQNSFLDI